MGPERRISRRDFLKAAFVGIGALELANSGLGEYLANLDPELPETRSTLSEYHVGWQARPWVWTNLAIASEQIKGRVIVPGEEVSMVSMLKLDNMQGVSGQNKDPRTGYVAGQMWSGVDGVGYGLCLASTAVFRATLNSPLRVTRRDTHYDIYESYFKDWAIGTDAAVYYPDPGDVVPESDLRISNPTDRPIALNFEVFDASGEKIAVPNEPLPEIWYKAAYADQVARMAQSKTRQLTGIDVPDQYIPEQTFGNRKIVVRASVAGVNDNYRVSISPVSKVNLDGYDEYTFTRDLVVANQGGIQSYTEAYISQYGKNPVQTS